MSLSSFVSIPSFLVQPFLNGCIITKRKCKALNACDIFHLKWILAGVVLSPSLMTACVAFAYTHGCCLLMPRAAALKWSRGNDACPAVLSAEERALTLDTVHSLLHSEPYSCAHAEWFPNAVGME